MRFPGVALCFSVALWIFSSISADARTSCASAMQRAESFLQAMGGREVWAKATYVHSKAVNRHPQARLPYIQEYWTDLEKPRTLNRLTNFDMDRLRGFNVDHGWGVKEGEAYEYDAERVANERKDWERSIYVKLTAIARRDKEVTIGGPSCSRLTFERNGVDMGWVELKSGSIPVRHAGSTGGTPVSFGPLEAFGDINWPREGWEKNGWKFEMLSIELGTGPLPVSFEMPKDLNNLNP